MVVGVEELENLDDLLQREVGLRDRGSELTDQQGGAGLIAVVALVAHLQDLRDHRLEVDLAVDGDGFLDDRVELVLDPFQAVDDLVAEGAEAENLAEALVHGAVRVVAGGLVDDLPDRHRIGHDTGHRADRVVVVAGVKGDLARGGQLFGLLLVGGEALVDEAADDGAADRAAHFIPGDRRAGVKDGLLGHTGDVLSGSAHPDKRRLRAEDAF